MFFSSVAFAQSEAGSDSWVATDALGRTLPTYEKVGGPRKDHFVGIFYFLWLGEEGSGGPFDITKILAKDPDAMQKPNSPLWGPLGEPHHWGESVFGYYRSNDPWVLRKHAQLLSDAGVDTVIFDTSNAVTYPRSYHALGQVWSQIRKEGGNTPQIAFLCPFWNPAPVVEALYDDLYSAHRYEDLWFRWKGKPLILADPALLKPENLRLSQRTPGLLEKGKTYGQTFTVSRPFVAVGGSFPTYLTTTSGMTLTLYAGAKPGGKRLLQKTFANLSDNFTALVETKEPLPAGSYYLEMSAPVGKIGWWSESGNLYAAGTAWSNGEADTGDRSLFIRSAGSPDLVPQLAAADAMTAEQRKTRMEQILSFFTFRKPQPDYFTGPTGPNQWGWLEVYPQKPYNPLPDGRPEEMTVGVAQNAVDGKLGVLSNPKSHGRSFHNGAEPAPGKQDYYGRNFTEQWEHALKKDPEFVFVTGWNEWIAGRFGANAPFYGAGPVSFVDQFNHEYSRDIEPVVGGHTDSYYYQFVSYVRRYKGVRPPEPPANAVAEPITIDGNFGDWATVGQKTGNAYKDDRLDDTTRDHPAWGTQIGDYKNNTGRNDFVTLKVAHDARNVYFYAQTREPIQAADAPNSMLLSVKRNGKRWDISAESLAKLGATRRVKGNEIEIAVPRTKLEVSGSGAFTLTFKWRDNVNDSADPLNLYRNGDTAPNARFEYVYRAAATSKKGGR